MVELAFELEARCAARCTHVVGRPSVGPLADVPKVATKVSYLSTADVRAIVDRNEVVILFRGKLGKRDRRDLGWVRAHDRPRAHAVVGVLAIRLEHDSGRGLRHCRAGSAARVRRPTGLGDADLEGHRSG